MRPGLRVVIADDAALWRAGIVGLLQDAGADVVAQAADAPTLTELVAEHRPDVAIVDVRMPPTFTDDGLRAALWVRRSVPGVGVLVLSQHVHAGAPLDLLGIGSAGVGYLLKERVSDPDQLIAAVQTVADGGAVIDRLVSEPLLARRNNPDDPLNGLSSRERQVLGEIAEGASNMAIGERLGIAPKTVDSHVSTILMKLGLEDGPDSNRRVLAVLTYLRAAGVAGLPPL